MRSAGYILYLKPAVQQSYRIAGECNVIEKFFPFLTPNYLIILLNQALKKDLCIRALMYYYLLSTNSSWVLHLHILFIFFAIAMDMGERYCWSQRPLNSILYSNRLASDAPKMKILDISLQYSIFFVPVFIKLRCVCLLTRHASAHIFHSPP